MNWTDKIDEAIGLNYRRALWTIAGFFAFLLALVIGGLLRPAQAEGITKSSGPIPVNEMAEAATWSGFNAGVMFGGTWTRAEFQDQFGDGKAVNTDNLLGAATIGWDLKMSNIVLGLMAELAGSGFNSSKTEWQWFVGARAGVLVSPRTLVYGLVGYTETVDGRLAFKSIDTTRFDNIAGLTVGGGVEQLLTAGWRMRLEYRYVSFGDEHAPEGVKDGLKDGSNIDTGSHSVRIGVVKGF